MTWLQVVVLAIVQGLSEFLPISSSGHLVLVPSAAGWADQGLAFDVAVHFGSLLAVCLFFRDDIAALLRKQSRDRQADSPDGGAGGGESVAEQGPARAGIGRSPDAARRTTHAAVV